MVPIVRRTFKSVSHDNSSVLTLKSILRYLLFAQGPFSSNLAEAMVFTRTQSHLRAPDLQIHFLSGLGNKYITDNLGIDYDPKEVPERGFSLFPTILHPKSMGKVSLRSNNPLDSPVVDPNYLSHPDDVQILKDGVKQSLKILNCPSMNEIAGDYYFNSNIQVTQRSFFL